MFQRAAFKLQARQSLSNQFSKTLLVTFFILLVSYLLAIAEYFSANTLVTFGISLVQLILSGPLLLAAFTYFLHIAKYDQANTNYFFSAFSSMGRAIPAFLWQSLRVFLWSCLLIIPGIVKNYAYSQYFFILAEQPKIGFNKALKTSEKITKGYKMELFMLDLSFCGWFILSTFTCGLALFYVLPYYFLAKAHLYHYLKTEALKQNVCTMDDFASDEIFAEDDELFEKPVRQQSPKQQPTQQNMQNRTTPDSFAAVNQAKTTERPTANLRKDDVHSLLEQISKDNPNLKEKIEAAKKEVDNKNKAAAEAAVKSKQTASVKPPTLDPSAIPEDILSHMQTLNKMAGHEPTKPSAPSKPQSAVKDIPGQPAYELYVFPAVEAMQREKAMRGENNFIEENRQPTEFRIQPKTQPAAAAPSANNEEDDFTAASYEYIADPTKLQ